MERERVGTNFNKTITNEVKRKLSLELNDEKCL